MNFFSSVTAQSHSQDDSEVLINVIVKQAPNGKTVATVPGFPELYIEALDRITALAQLQEALEKYLTGASDYPPPALPLRGGTKYGENFDCKKLLVCFHQRLKSHLYQPLAGLLKKRYCD